VVTLSGIQYFSFGEISKSEAGSPCFMIGASIPRVAPVKPREPPHVDRRKQRADSELRLVSLTQQFNQQKQQLKHSIDSSEALTQSLQRQRSVLDGQVKAAQSEASLLRRRHEALTEQHHSDCKQKETLQSLLECIQSSDPSYECFLASKLKLKSLKSKHEALHASHQHATTQLQRLQHDQLRTSKQLAKHVQKVEALEAHLVTSTASHEGLKTALQDSTQALQRSKQKLMAIKLRCDCKLRKLSKMRLRMQHLDTLHTALQSDANRAMQLNSNAIQKLGRLAPHMAHCVVDEHEDEHEDEDPKVIHQTMATLKAEITLQSSEVACLAPTVDPTVVERFNQLELALHEAVLRIAESELTLDLLRSTNDKLEAQRATEFLDAIARVNEHLSPIYQELSFSGDCYLSSVGTGRVVFETGVMFQVRPDKLQWKAFKSVSGGQKALATFALCMAINRVFPSALYLLDEMDASLDSTAVTRVATYIHKMKDTAQFVVVSHRPQLYECFDSIVGTYAFDRSSHVVCFGPSVGHGPLHTAQ